MRLTWLRGITDSGVVMTWANHAVVFASAVVIMPLILRAFSKEEIAVWFVFNSLSNIVQLADAGFAPTLVRAVSYFQAGADSLPKSVDDSVSRSPEDTESEKTPNYAKLISLHSTARTIYLCLIIGSVLLMSFGGILLVRNVIRLAGDSSTLWASYGVLIATGAMSVAQMRWSSFLQGLDRIALLRRYEVMLGVIRILGSFALLLMGQKILALMIWGFIGTLVQYVLLRRAVLNSLEIEVRGFHRNKIGFDSDLFRTLWPAAWRNGLLACGSFIANYGSAMVVSQIGNAALISQYFVTLRIVGMIRQIAQTPLYARLPQFFRLFAQGRLADVKTLLSGAIASSVVLVVAPLIALGLAGDFVFSVLQFNTTLLEDLPYTLLCLAVVLEMHHSMHSQIYMATNHVPFVVPSLISGGVIIAVGAFLVERGSLLDFIAVQLFVQGGFSNWYPVMLSLNLLRWSARDYFRDLLQAARRVLTCQLGLRPS